MADILKTLPYLTIEDYMWGYSSSFIRLMAYDQSRIKYLKKKDGDEEGDAEHKAFTADDVFKSLGADKEFTDSRTVAGDWLAMLTQGQQNGSGENNTTEENEQ